MHAGRALGLSERQVVSKVEWPLALPLVISAREASTLQVVATATVAAYSSGVKASVGCLSRAMRHATIHKCSRALSMVAVLAVVLDIFS